LTATWFSLGFLVDSFRFFFKNNSFVITADQACFCTTSQLLSVAITFENILTLNTSSKVELENCMTKMDVPHRHLVSSARWDFPNRIHLILITFLVGTHSSRDLSVGGREG
jgi:hypothetical protein